MRLKAGQMVAERYEIDDTIGSGGMSVVYRAHDTKLDRYVTLKVLKEDYLEDESLMERFPKEARAAAALNHQNITSIFDHGRDGDILYIVLEYVDGASLKELINKKAPFDDATNLGVTIQVAEGLSEAHRNNIIHLDIKPQNILVTTTSIVKVADFGIARAAKSVTLNAAAGSMGSVHYFSPEQARGGYIDHKSDIYSLGVVMFEMATGKLPFEGENEVSIALQHINDPLPDILKINPNVSDSVNLIIKKATEKSASKRYHTIDDMVDDLKRALTDASGDFVDFDGHDESPTRSISEENKEAVRRQKMRAAFLDGVDTPEDDDMQEGGFLLHGVTVQSENPKDNLTFDDNDDETFNYQEGQEYSEEYTGDYEDFTAYPDDFYDERKAPSPPRDKKADRVAVYGGIILGGILGLVILFLSLYLYRNIFSPTAGMIEVPDVVGMPWLAAEIEIRRLGLTPIEEYAYCGYEFYCDTSNCDGDCIGQVIGQRTLAGRMLSPDDVLHVVISLGQAGEGEPMPRIENTVLEDALILLEALEIELDIQIEFYDDITFPRDVIIEQSPEPNTLLNNGDTITLLVSYGPDGALVNVPLLVGITEPAALDILRENSLVAVSERAHSDTFAVGLIIRQEPEPGELVERNSIVTYFVSQGPETPMPTPTPPPAPEETDDPTDIPEPTPSPDTSPEPPTAPEPEYIDGTLTIHLWPVPEGTEYVHLLVQRQLGNAGDAEAPFIFNNPNVPVDLFPLTINVQYIDPTVFLVFSGENGVLVGPRALENRP
ncbi:MAG: Stk1 family PASTA domain-containing Ser/Thr kinase [Defluviitaleaceae bacterium]|nr:Stk1 family PASTA domain-containing Ser/Thr kinase [Defluviitaleaceae bacterium]